MESFLKIMQMFLKSERGATMVEYGLMVALIAVVAMVGAALIGQNVNSKFNEVATTIDTAG